MSDSWANRLKDAAATAMKTLDDSGLKEQVGEKLQQTKKMLDEAGVTEQYGKASAVVSDHFDMVAGVKQLALVEERLALQTQYNDILATKLTEALARIQSLEDSVATLTRLHDENRRVS